MITVQRIILALFLLSHRAACAFEGRRGDTSTFRRSSSSAAIINKSKVLSVRGGAWSPRVAAAAAGTIINGLYAAKMAIFPKNTAEKMYGFVVTPAVEFAISSCATTIYPAVVTMWCLAFKKTPTTLNTAIGATAVPFALRSLYSIVQNKPQEMGYSAWWEYVNFAMHSVMTAATLTNSPHAELAIKGWAAWLLLSGMVYLVQPSLYATDLSSKMGSKQRRNVEVVNRAFGIDSIMTGAFVAALAVGVETIQAFGYAWVVACGGMASILLFTSDCQDLGIVLQTRIWIAYMAMMGGTMVFT